MRQTRWFALFLGCLLSASFIMTGLAQGTPAAGDERTVIDAEGTTLGVVTVEEAQDPFDGYVEGAEPEDGMRYVLLQVAFEATGEAIFDAQPSSVLIQDADGMLWRPANVRRDDAALPDLQSQSLSSGNRISGAITYAIPEDAGLAQVVYRPDSRRLLVLADLRDGGAADPATGDEVAYSSIQNTSAEATFNVMDVTDPLDHYAEGSDPDEGMRYVAVTVSIEATGGAIFSVQPNQMVLRDRDGFIWTPVNINRGEDLEQPNLEGQPLAPGNIISGVLGYEIPADTEVASVLLLPSNDQVITLASLVESSGGVNAEATPA